MLQGGFGEVVGKKGKGTPGWVIARPVAGSGAVILQFRSREGNSDTDREGDSAPHPLGGAGGSLEYHQTKLRMGLYRDGATLYKCTQRRQQS